MDITLTLSEEVAQHALALARERELTVEQLLAKLLEQACHERPGDAFARVADLYSGRSEPGWRFDREACHERTPEQ
ncbi:MAG: hypothetical protein HYU66_14130 [Armatimonadetes bacterium]|nr:hypothetical protein [Armatimonadota bacterium]